MSYRHNFLVFHDWLNTFRIYFRTNSSLVGKKASLTEYPACYNNLGRALHMLHENV